MCLSTFRIGREVVSNAKPMSPFLAFNHSFSCIACFQTDIYFLQLFQLFSVSFQAQDIYSAIAGNRILFVLTILDQYFLVQSVLGNIYVYAVRLRKLC